MSRYRNLIKNLTKDHKTIMPVEIEDLMNEKLTFIIEMLSKQNKLISKQNEIVIEISKLNLELLQVINKKLDSIISNQK
jgi:hypothetical protein